MTTESYSARLRLWWKFANHVEISKHGGLDACLRERSAAVAERTGGSDRAIGVKAGRRGAAGEVRGRCMRTAAMLSPSTGEEQQST